MPIKVLDDHTINKIAAGEVVERPASVLRELLENAIDAGATSIQIQLQAGGSKLIRIRDNGSGMSRDDARMCLLRHATSKITSEADIFSIRSLGFRGEAIPSIASISKFEILTKRKEDAVGTRIIVEGGNTTSVEDAGCPIGTQITVKDLFFNVPARLKFLRRESTELSHCISTVLQEVLIRPWLDVSLSHKNATLIRATTVATIPERAKMLFPKEGTSLINVDISNSHFKIKAWISPIGIHFAGSSQSFMYVNDRHIKDTSVRRAIREAYQGLIPKGRYPAIILQIEVDPKDVDVNVHPAKTEVRFKNIRSLSQLINFGFRKHLQEEGIKTEVLLQNTVLPPRSPLPVLGQAQIQSTQKQHSSKTIPNVTFSESIPQLAPQEKQGTLPLFDKPSPNSNSSNPFVNSHKEEELFLKNIRQSENNIPSVSEVPKAHSNPLETRENTTSIETEIGLDQNNFNQERTILSPENTTKSENNNKTPVQKFPSSVFWTKEGTWHFEDSVEIENSKLVVTHTEKESSEKEPEKQDDLLFRWPFYVPKKIVEHDEQEAFLLQYKEMHNLLPTPTFGDLRVIGQLGKTYLLCEGGGELVIIDQHAAHERIVLFRLQKNMFEQLGGLQQFLTPELIDLSVQRYHALLPRLDVLEYYGFSIEPFGDQTFVIRQAPVTLMNINYQEMLESVADALQEGYETTPLKEKIDLMLATKACHNSIRAGERLSELQIQNLLHELDEVDFEVCAHGRPVVIRYSFSDLEKRFHRN